MIKAAIAAAAVLALGLAGYVADRQFGSAHTRLTALPKRIVAALAPHLPHAPAHTVIIIEENKEYSDIVGNTKSAPYINSLIARGALFTHSYGVAHPSQPNYLALFAGVTDSNGDRCPPRGYNSNAPNLSTELRAAHRTFAGYAEDLPAAGSRVCSAGNYARKHVPWTDFTNVPASEIQPFSALPRYAKLPTVAFIIPNLLDDMHSASIARGDSWLRANLAPLIAWAMQHDTLVIITCDESSDLQGNHIPTVFVGPMIRSGRYAQTITHYSVLRTIEDLYGLTHAGGAASAPPIADVWK